MYKVYYKFQFEPTNEITFDTEEEANSFAERQRLKGWDAVVVRNEVCQSSEDMS